ncbi:acyl-CoA dehydrogenase family protein [Sphingomonas sp.]|uniref:acyl-CoA dehydrogenase family protein n=1 Tax=Sphingomonas sp. TaxID=28214 RepID=UPI00286C35DB|nr:acyl-CoA dehydrogenase family protein [Sphingomonas sp.]
MAFEYTAVQEEIREAVRRLCAGFGVEYWRACDERGDYPEAFVAAMTEAGWLGALIPEEYGGSGLGVLDGCLILQEINRSGGNGASCHAQMYTMASILNHGSVEQKKKYLPRIADGSLRLQAFGVTEPNAGSNTLAITTYARRTNEGYVINGQKIWTSRFFQSHLYLFVARTTSLADVKRKTDGLSLFLVDIAKAGDSLRATPIPTMLNHHTNEVFIDDLHVSTDDLIGEEGKGFQYLVDSLNSERLLVSSESIGDGQWFVSTASAYASERNVFDRPIGANQGIQFPIARAHMNIVAAELMRNSAANLLDSGKPCAQETLMTKYLATEASWEAAEACMTTFGGYGVATEYHVERKWKEARLFRTAPISNNLVLAQVAQHGLGMPRSY